MKAFSRFEKEILEFYPHVTKGKCCGEPFAQCNHEEEKYWKNAFMFIWETGTGLCKTLFKLNH